MPFWGLVITSLGFSIPSLLAFKNRKKWLGKSCGILTCTSVLYHGTQHILCKTIDMCYAHTIGIIYLYKSISRCFICKRIYDLYIFTGSCGSLLLFYKGSCNSNIPLYYQNCYHMLFHVVSQSMLTLHAIDSKM